MLDCFCFSQVTLFIRILLYGLVRLSITSVFHTRLKCNRTQYVHLYWASRFQMGLRGIRPTWPIPAQSSDTPAAIVRFHQRQSFTKRHVCVRPSVRPHSCHLSEPGLLCGSFWDHANKMLQKVQNRNVLPWTLISAFISACCNTKDFPTGGQINVSLLLITVFFH